MKKFVSLILTVCMLLMAAVGAMAEEQSVRVILQDDMTPELATVTCADGEQAYAVVYDAAGAEVAHVTDAAQITLVDKTGADHAFCIGNHDLDAHYMLMEKFGVILPEGIVIPEGGYVEMAFTVQDWQPLPAMVKVVENNEEIHDATITAQNGKTVTVQMCCTDMINFLLDFGVGQTVEDTYDAVVIPGEPESNTEMFTPSVSGKPAPSVIASVDAEGDVVVASVMSTVSDDVIPVKDDATLAVIPVAERDYVMDARIHGGLEWAYKTISVARSLAELPAVPTEEAENLGVQIDEVLKAAGSELTHNDMIVRDLFAVNLYGELGEEVKTVEKYLNVKFDLGVEPGTPVVVLVSADNVNWTVLPNSEVTVYADGTVAINLPELGNVAFVVPVPQPENMVTSPATGE